MLRTNDELWICLGTNDNHALRYAMACGVVRDVTLFRFEPGHDPVEHLARRTEIIVCFNGPNGFCEQPATIVRRDNDVDGVIYGFELTGEAAGAENREADRVGITVCGVTALINGEHEARVLDVSRTGLSVLTEAEPAVTTGIAIAFEVERDEFSGRCCVRSVRPGPGGVRLGLQWVPGEGNLQAGLRRLTIEAQRAQLRRLSRAG